jgi:hypothetical protein
MVGLHLELDLDRDLVLDDDDEDVLCLDLLEGDHHLDLLDTDHLESGIYVYNL